MKTPLAAALFLIASVPQLSAQSLSVDPSAVQTCYDSTPIGATFPECLGSASDRCQLQDGGSTTIGITDCIMSENAAWDGLLNEAYKSLRATWADREGGAGGLSGDELNASLRDAQRAWIAFRDAECNLQYDRYRGGTIRSIVGANCLMVMTASRAIVLRDMAVE